MSIHNEVRNKKRVINDEKKRQTSIRILHYAIFSILIVVCFSAVITSNLDINKSYVLELSQSNIESLTLEKRDKSLNDSLLLSKRAYLNTDDIDDLNTKGMIIIPIFDDYNQYMPDIDEDKISLYTALSIYGGIEINQSNVDEMNFNVIFGTIPLNTNQVMISYHYAQSLILHNSFNKNYTKVDELINEVVNIRGKELSISGIIDTHFDRENIYDFLQDMSSFNELSKSDRKLYTSYLTEVEYGWTNLLYFCEDFYDIELRESYQKIDFINHEYNAYVGNIGGTYQSIDYINELNNQNVNYVLKQNEIIISSSLLKYEDAQNISRDIVKLRNELIDTFAKENYELIRAEFIEDDHYDDEYQYAYYIKNSNENKYQTQYDYNYFSEIAEREVIDDYMASKDLTYQINRFNYSKTFDVVDIIYEPLFNNNSIFVSNENFLDLQKNIGIFKGVKILVDENYSINDLIQSNTDPYYDYKIVSNDFLQFESDYDSLRSNTIYILLAMLPVFMLLVGYLSKCIFLKYYVGMNKYIDFKDYLVENKKNIIKIAFLLVFEVLISYILLYIVDQFLIDISFVYFDLKIMLYLLFISFIGLSIALLLTYLSNYFKSKLNN